MASIISGTEAEKDHVISKYSSEIQEIYDKAREAEPAITEKVNDIAQSLGCRLEGLEYSVKTAGSVVEKLDRTQDDSVKTNVDFNPVTVISEMKDLVRYTEICDHDKIPEITKSTISAFEKAGYGVFGVKNYYNNPYPSTGYKGIHINVITPGGQKFEFQVHSKESFEAKQEGHKLYEIIRSEKISDEDKAVAREKIFEIHGSVDNPDGIEEILDVKEDPNEVLDRLEAEAQDDVSADGEDISEAVMENTEEMIGGCIEGYAQEPEDNDEARSTNDDTEQKIESGETDPIDINEENDMENDNEYDNDNDLDNTSGYDKVD